MATLKVVKSRTDIGPLEAPPSPPAWMTGEQREVWTSTAEYMANRGTLHSADVGVLEAYALAVVRLRHLDRETADCPLTENGKAHPSLRITESVSATVAKLASMLCLSPSSRVRLPQRVIQAAGTDGSDAEWKEALGK